MSKFFSGFLVGVAVAYFLMKIAEKNQFELKETLENWKKNLADGDGALKKFFQRKKGDKLDNYSETAPESI